MVHPHPSESTPMAKPNYSFEKRQREQQKKLKKMEKAQRKANGAPAEAAPLEPTPQAEPHAG